jgi:hypothetical protein
MMAPIPALSSIARERSVRIFHTFVINIQAEKKKGRRKGSTRHSPYCVFFVSFVGAHCTGCLLYIGHGGTTTCSTA